MSFHKLCVDMHVSKTKFEKKVSRVLSHDLYWENRTYKLKRSIGIIRMRVFAGLLEKKNPHTKNIRLFVCLPFSCRHERLSGKV